MTRTLESHHLGEAGWASHAGWDERRVPGTDDAASAPEETADRADQGAVTVDALEVVKPSSGPFAGGTLLFAGSGDTVSALEIIDYSDPSQPVMLSSVPIPNSEIVREVSVDPTMTTVVIGNQPSLFVRAVLTYDVTDVMAPQFLTALVLGDGNIRGGEFVGDTLWYARFAYGIEGIDVSDPSAPVIRHRFDTAPFAAFISNFALQDILVLEDEEVVFGIDNVRGGISITASPPALEWAIPGGMPETLSAAGTDVDVTLTQAVPGTLEPGSVVLVTDTGSGFVSTPLVSLGGDDYRASFPAAACGTSVTWYLEARTTGGMRWTCPLPAPGLTASTAVGAAEAVLLAEAFEGPAGWTVGAPGDTATTGVWTLADPMGVGPEPPTDHTPNGTMCWVTGQGGGVGVNDVDAGATTLTSARYDLSAWPEAHVSYWRWYINGGSLAPEDDVFEVFLSNDDGVTWLPVESIGPGGMEVHGGWVRHAFRVADTAPVTATMRLRFVAQDLAEPSLVEALIDDLEIFLPSCSAPTGVRSCTPAVPNSTGRPARVQAFGSDVAADNDVRLVVTDIPSRRRTSPT
ncbi:MAG: hypothetical protein GY711_05645 [bacterium]|nr:hypothetical protein [bacterium]